MWGFSLFRPLAANIQDAHQQAVLCLEVYVMIFSMFLESAVQKAWLIPDPVLTSIPHFQPPLLQAHFDMACASVKSSHPSSSMSIWYLALGGYMEAQLETAWLVN